MALSGSVLSLVFGCLPLKEAVQCRLVCVSWATVRASLHRLDLNREKQVARVLSVIEPRRVRSLRVSSLSETRVLATLADIEQLELEHPAHTSVVPALWPGLRSLIVQKRQGEDLAWCRELPCLRSLDASYNILEKPDIDDISGLTNLLSLDISTTFCLKEDVGALASLVHLTTLAIGGNPFLDDEALSFITSLTALRTLDAEDLPLTDAVVEKLEALPHLEVLNLNLCRKIKGSAFDRLGSLKTLDLRHCTLCSPLRLPARLQTLYVAWVELGVLSSAQSSLPLLQIKMR